MSGFAEEFNVSSSAQISKRVPRNKWPTFITVKDTFYSILKSPIFYFLCSKSQPLRTFKQQPTLKWQL
jgi:hypothetical protein